MKLVGEMSGILWSSDLHNVVKEFKKSSSNQKIISSLPANEQKALFNHLHSKVKKGEEVDYWRG